MNEPPGDPNPPPGGRPLGSTFWILFFAPVAIFLVGILILANYRHTSDGPGIAFIFMGIAGCVAVLSSVACATMVGTRSGGLAGFLSLCGFVMFYLTVVFVGCSPFFGSK
jgi:hypothetical protein